MSGGEVGILVFGLLLAVWVTCGWFFAPTLRRVCSRCEGSIIQKSAFGLSHYWCPRCQQPVEKAFKWE